MIGRDEVFDLFEHESAIWFFDYHGDPLAPHAELTSGLCSDGFINCRLVLCNPAWVALIASRLVELAKMCDVGKPDWVVGSAYSAIVLSYEVARLMGAKHGFVQKSETDPKTMVWPNLSITEGATVLQCEELITTSGTRAKVRDAIDKGIAASSPGRELGPAHRQSRLIRSALITLARPTLRSGSFLFFGRRQIRNKKTRTFRIAGPA